jgi:hypothetical protein
MGSHNQSIGQTEQGLDLNDTSAPYLPWPNGQVPYCYQPSPPISGYPQPGSASFEDSIELTEDAIAKLEAVDGATIDFQGGGLCPDWDDYLVGTDVDTLRIVITNGDAATRWCSPQSIAQGQTVDDVCAGVSPGQEVVVVFGENFNNGPVAAILHELLHALGFRHEYLRRGSESEGCNPNSTVLPDPGITEYDRASVLNSTYCHGNTELSAYDNAGLAFVFPDSTADELEVPFTIRLPTALLLAPGNQHVGFKLRARGVQEHHYAGAQWHRAVPLGWTSILNSSSNPAVGSSLATATALGGAAQASIRAIFTDFFGRQRVTPTATFRKDVGLYTALVLSTSY